MEETSPIELVEAHLRAQHLYNEEHEIWPDDNTVIERLLAASEKMAPVYKELFRICPAGHPQNSKWEYWQYVINDIVEVASGWHPNKIGKVREAIREINGKDGKGLNQRIKEQAKKLADLLRQRDQFCENHNLEHPNDYHPLELIEPAAKIASYNGGYGAGTHGRYTSFVKKNIDALRGQFDLKYWPRTADMLDALAEMQDVEPTPRNRLDAAALINKNNESNFRRDFLRPLEEAMQNVQHLDFKIEFTHRSLATITNCTLGLSNEIDKEYIKTFRKQEREHNK